MLSSQALYLVQIVRRQWRNSASLHIERSIRIYADQEVCAILKPKSWKRVIRGRRKAYKQYWRQESRKWSHRGKLPLLSCLGNLLGELRFGLPLP